ncbi:MAG: cytochrome c [Gammaproteobacteria bacterium]|nr:cytochrome c [Gammaproteobacteria bacterium]
MKFGFHILTMAALLLAGQVSSAMAANKFSAENPPKMPYKYALGKQKFTQFCAKCHGEWGYGTRQGPPFIHRFYKPSHHADPAFYRAPLKGVTAHHWRFGDMPPVPGITRKDLDSIVPFIRWLQRENKLY